MIYLRLGILAIIILAIYLAIKLLQSPKFDKLCNDLVEGNLDTEPTVQDTIKKISNAEKDMNKQAEKNIKEAERLKTESKNISSFLGKRGVTKTKKKREGS